MTMSAALGTTRCLPPRSLTSCHENGDSRTRPAVHQSGSQNAAARSDQRGVTRSDSKSTGRRTAYCASHCIQSHGMSKHQDHHDDVGKNAVRPAGVSLEVSLAVSLEVNRLVSLGSSAGARVGVSRAGHFSNTMHRCGDIQGAHSRDNGSDRDLPSHPGGYTSTNGCIRFNPTATSGVLRYIDHSVIIHLYLSFSFNLTQDVFASVPADIEVSTVNNSVNDIIDYMPEDSYTPLNITYEHRNVQDIM
ncbi:hypothetical protein SAMN05421854_110174 [Amycolatopsis rubida]|uniref:Uncharacterized protein n=1 Tax=Amycolatopsis rubida TaxID=112413 RepID=A0A1I5XEP6_9PSEU|nr:hypothetical protein SAMN05421854_110174 [Amycolatopsis rubida]